MHYNNWNEGLGGLGAELNLLKTQLRKNSLNVAKIVKSAQDPCQVITSVRTQPLLFHSSKNKTNMKMLWTGIRSIVNVKVKTQF